MQLQRPICIDLFAGAGGLSLGFEQAGYDVLAAIELDPIHAATHEFNFPYGVTLCADVREVSGSDIRNWTPVGDREVDVVVGGAPCQGFSLIGKRALDDPRNHLVREFARLVVELNPRHFVLENVAGLTQGKHRLFLAEVIRLFEAAGYQVEHDFRVLQASEFGVPQSRQRLFLLGSRADVPLPRYPAPITVGRRMNGAMRPPLPLLADMPLGPSVRDAIGDLPNADDYDALLERDWARVRFGRPSAYASLLRGVAVDPDDFSRPRSREEALLTSSLRTVHTAKSVARFSKTVPGQVEPVSRFLRLHPDGVSNTLRAGTASDRGAFTSPRPIHPLHPRCITVREAARLHGYPDWFRFHVTKWHGFRQIGNSVPPPLARAVARELLRSIGVRPNRGKEQTLGDPALLEMTQAQAARHFGVRSDVIPRRQRIA